VPRAGVLLTAFGGPRNLDEVAPFMRSLLGMEPPEAALAEAKRKYVAIGGGSPLPAMADRIATLLRFRLGGVPVEVGMRHSEPSIESAVARLASAGVEEIVVVSLSPFDAEVTTGAYREAVDAAAAQQGLAVVPSGPYHRSGSFIDVLGGGVAEALRAAERSGKRTLVLFSAHSLPLSDLAKDPTYELQLRETATAVAAHAGLGAPSVVDGVQGLGAFGGTGGAAAWLLGFQSKGRRGGEWAGPDLGDVIDAAAAAGYGAIVVSPIGFALDHMETLYDIDVVAAGRAPAPGLEFHRAPVPNDDARMIDALAQAVELVL
jgi:ferrochelatase